MSVIGSIIVGAIAGWLAGLAVQGTGFGLPGNLLIGIIGSCIAGYLFPSLAPRLGGVVGSILASAAGAVILLVAVGLIRRVL